MVLKVKDVEGRILSKYYTIVVENILFHFFHSKSICTFEYNRCLCPPPPDGGPASQPALKTKKM